MSGPCAVHSDQPWAFTCTRCGSFACAACKGALPGQCLACSTALGFLSFASQVLVSLDLMQQALWGGLLLRIGLVPTVWMATSLAKPRWPAVWVVLTLVPWLWVAIMAWALHTLWSYLSKAGLNPGLFALSIPRPGAK